MKKLVLSLVGIFTIGLLSAQTYPFVSISQITFVDSLTLANCSDSSSFIGDTVRTVGIVVTDGDLSEVASGSIIGGSRPFITMIDTANNGAPGPWKSIVVMGVVAGTNNPEPDIENAVAGDILEITGIIGQFAGLIQFQPLNSTATTVLSSTTPPTFVTINAGEIQDNQRRNILPTGEKYEGAYVELKNMTVTNVSIFSGGSRVEFTVQDAAGNQVLVADRFLPMRVSGQPTVNPNSPDSVGRLIPPSVGTIYNHIRGVIFQDENGCRGGGSFAGGYEINPVYATDFDKAAPPPEVTNIKRNPLVPNASQSVNVTANITDADGVVTGATLFYTADQSAAPSLFSSVTMSNVGSLYSGTIPSFPLDSIVRYFIEATDDSNKTTTTPIEYYTVRNGGLTIMDLQLVPGFATSDASAYDGDTVTVTGIVTASFQQGDLGFLYIQDTSASEFAGIYVNGGPLSVFSFNRGDEIRVTGRVNENFGFTRINADSAVATSNTGTINPIVLDPSDPSLFGSNNAGLEKYESMLLRYENPQLSGTVNVIDTNIRLGNGNPTGEFTVGSGFLATTAARVLTGRQVNGQAQGSANVSYVSDTAAFAANLNPGITPIQINRNFMMDHLDGILYYAFGDYKLTPRNNADFSNLIVSVQEIETSNVATSIYPNPTSNRLAIQIDEAYQFSLLNIQLFDLTGRLVVDTRTSTNLTNINLAGLEKGLYILKVTENNQLINTSKIILQ